MAQPAADGRVRASPRWLRSSPASLRSRVSSASPFRRIALRASGWTLVDAAGVEHTANLVAHVRLGTWLVLDFRSANRHRFRAVLGPDNIDADTRRRLILLLSRAEVAQAG